VTETRLLIGGEQVPGAGDPLEVENPYIEETKHVHIETQIALKEWWYPYGSGPDQPEN
jgi:hypothetical protein